MPATPLEYLRRLSLANHWFADDIQLEGLIESPQGWQIVTSQPDIVGTAPDSVALNDALTSLHRFQRLHLPAIGHRASHGYLRDRIALFDAHPANFVLSQGVLVPIDVILVDLTPDQAAYLGRWLAPG